MSDPMLRLEWPCRSCRHWIQGNVWWDVAWQAEPDVEGDRTLVYALAFNLLLGITCYKKYDGHLITYKSGKGSLADRLYLSLKSDPWQGSTPLTSASCKRYEN